MIRFHIQTQFQKPSHKRSVTAAFKVLLFYSVFVFI